ncbi:HlyU family transcriptional regulator [Sedimenticola thiotaurini]|uniref:Uncharacterized protein n=1 Tax=Sedimenticola thiotaurini TaxID=1543721 RepID=A0A0F7JV03_9GAMM|nr:HlyU family transcriptional regulator [Sedimenticola thiotaurini]AKH19144.1 hypothetical protein AAY24_00930 [Sedimenticola thiotaurini]
MGLIEYLKSLFVAAGAEEPEPELETTLEYKGFEIRAEPKAEDGQFRVQGWISRAGQIHHFIRADLLPSHETCIAETLRKARVLVDQQGDDLFR